MGQLTTGFPTQVNVQPGVGVVGQFCSSNPRASVLSKAGAFVAGAAGLTIGAFAWLDPSYTYASNGGGGLPAGFVANEEQGVNTTFLSSNGLAILPGMACTLFNEGEFWALNAGSSAVTPGMKAYANNSNGSITFNTTGNPPSGATSTASTLASNTASSTSSIVQPSVTATFAPNTGAGGGGIMTVSAVGAGSLGVGMVLSGTNVDPATTITAQLTGSAGGTGTYAVSVSQTITAATAVAAPLWGTLTTAGTITGYIAAGQTVSGTGVTSGTTIYGLISGTGGASAGVYSVYAPTTMAAVSGQALTMSGGLLTVGGTVAGTFAVGDTLNGRARVTWLLTAVP